MKLKVLILLIMCAVGISATAKKLKTKSGHTVTKVYMYGLSTNFNDSTVWMTDVQVVDSACIEKKTRFLINRGSYAQQMTDYFNSRGETDRTNTVFYETNLKRAHKQYMKVRSRYDNSNAKLPKYRLDILMADEFRFKAESPDLHEPKIKGSRYNGEQPIIKKKKKRSGRK